MMIPLIITAIVYMAIAVSIAYAFDFQDGDLWPIVMCMLWPLCMLFLVMMRVIEGVDHEG